MATAEGTARLLRRAVDRGALHARQVRGLGPAAQATPRLSVSALGFGAYRVGGGAQEPAHLAVLREVLRSGINVLDTSTHYSAGSGAAHGSSERLVARAIAEAVEAGEVEREGLVLCTKLGHAALGGPAPPGAVPIGPPGAQGAAAEVWHSIDPDFVRAEVRGSRERLGTPPDFVLLHNPEYFLSAQLHQRVPIADAWDEMYERLTRAFEALEELCDDGTIASGYGVSGNFLSCLFSTTGRPNLYEALALDRVVDAAKVAAKGRADGHRFRIAQLPLNAVESGAVLGRGGAVPEAAAGDCELAANLGVALVSNRPLNALPLPGVSSGDWGRNGAEHLRLRQAKPMGAVESLLRRVIVEALGEGEGVPLQQLALRLAMSAPGMSCTLNGMRSEGHLQDALAVLKEAPVAEARVKHAMAKVRSAAEELGCTTRGLW